MHAFSLLLFLANFMMPDFAHPVVRWQEPTAPWPARIAPDVAQMLAQRHAVNQDGAMGRNRRAYFHARFQFGVHQIAEAAALRRDPGLAERALDAIEYAVARQTPAGGFELVVPDALAGWRPPSEVDLASGSAFFLASASTALLLLDPPGTADDWLPESEAARVAALQPSISRAISYLRNHRKPSA